ncbi:hypothetical protein F5148DRAFT_554625 [Russula earlei]|uniref:Uncharacterized protein n=1 Tax=Russula earlei TaxID=71964 RepID=A0ACC0UFU4_9AGAM|nr:hypothetical protein F5148DRAFT_554625 [Russula earlei]
MSEDPESRILVVSASPDQARAAVKLIKAFAGGDTSDLPTSNSIPWTIRNKYYSADVHFHLAEYAQWDPQSARRVPAAIFVWTRGQPYAEHVFALQNGLSRFEPEVALAIALGREPPHHDDPPEGPDSFLADHGFEYIDGERTGNRGRARHPGTTASATARAPTPEENGDADDADDVPGLARVVDALSTIMWPTMVREQDATGGGGKRKGQRLGPSLFDFDDGLLRGEPELEGVNEEEEEEEETLAALMEADAADHGAPLTRARRVQREMEALERWLVENEASHEAEYGGTTGADHEDDENHDGDELPSIVLASAPDVRAPGADPWAAASPNHSSRPTPTLPFTAAPPHVTTSSSGFDDDFAAFISAPPAIVLAGPAATATATAAAPSPTASGSIAHLLLPTHTGGSFHSSRSGTSDVDVGEDAGYEALDDRSSFNLSIEHEHEHAPAFDDDGAGLRTSIGQRVAALGDAPFDLTNMLSALRTIREDVAVIEDEAERRATTARFASEFVYKRMSGDGDESQEKES